MPKSVLVFDADEVAKIVGKIKDICGDFDGGDIETAKLEFLELIELLGFGEHPELSIFRNMATLGGNT